MYQPPSSLLQYVKQKHTECQQNSEQKPANFPQSLTEFNNKSYLVVVKAFILNFTATPGYRTAASTFVLSTLSTVKKISLNLKEYFIQFVRKFHSGFKKISCNFQENFIQFLRAFCSIKKKFIQFLREVYVIFRRILNELRIILKRISRKF